MKMSNNHKVAEYLLGYRWWTPQQLKPFNLYSAEEGDILMHPNFTPGKCEHPLFIKDNIPNFSENLDLAFSLLKELPYHNFVLAHEENEWDAMFQFFTDADGYIETEGTGKTPAEAIVKAVLNSLEENFD